MTAPGSSAPGDTPPATPKVSRRPAIPLVWVVPLVALAIAAWMLARQFRDRGPEITIEFAHSAGIEAGKTVLEHKGVTVGTVHDVSLKPDLSGVVVHLRLTKSGAGLAREGSAFWIVQPEVSLFGVRGLETLVNGVRINVRPGSGPPASTFRGLDRPPPLDDRTAGRAFVLRADSLGRIMPESPVFYRDVRVGSVETTWLADNATAAMIRIRILAPYADLVRTNTQFWNASGISMKFGFTGAEIRMATLQSVVAGGVSFATQGSDSVAPPALDGTEFILHPEPQKEWLEWKPRIKISPLESSPVQPALAPESDGAPAAKASGG